MKTLTRLIAISILLPDLRVGAEPQSQRKPSPPSVEELVQQLKDKSERIRTRAAESLGKAGPDAREAVPAIVEALNDKVTGVRIKAAAADILTQVVAPDQPTLPQEIARAVLSVRFNDSATETIRELLQKNNAGTITTEEKADLEKYMRVGQFLDLMQAKARQSLKATRSA